MKPRKLWWCSIVIVLLLSFANDASASPIALGVVSFDTFVTGPGGTNAFFISNFTGDPATGGFSLPPDFPVVTALTFTAPTLAWVGPSGSPYDFGGVGIGPGTLDPPPSLQFPDTTAFVSATFSAVLSTTLFQLEDGRSFQALSSQILALLTNPNGALQPGDFATISVDAVEVPTTQPVPEPTTVTLLASGLAMSWMRHRRSAKKNIPLVDTK